MFLRKYLPSVCLAIRETRFPRRIPVAGAIHEYGRYRADSLAFQTLESAAEITFGFGYEPGLPISLEWHVADVLYDGLVHLHSEPVRKHGAYFQRRASRVPVSVYEYGYGVGAVGMCRPGGRSEKAAPTAVGPYGAVKLVGNQRMAARYGWVVERFNETHAYLFHYPF